MAVQHQSFRLNRCLQVLGVAVALLGHSAGVHAADQLLIHAVTVDRPGQMLYIDGEYLKDDKKKAEHPVVELGSLPLQVIYSEPGHVRAQLPNALADGEYQLLVAVDEKKKKYETGTYSLTIAALEKGEQGEAGPAGPQGEPGPVGPMGPQGDQGPQGPQGEQGDQGPQGIAGLQGDKGDQGDPGPIGPAGPQGDQGPQGEQGPQGVQGEPGEQGPQGIAGIQGDKGDQGDPGPMGPAGPQGDQGSQGLQGEPGEQGPQGIAGIQGDKGDQGDPGPVGPAGPQGVAGEPGPAGAPGLAGPPGPQGPAGPPGADGANGQDGVSCEVSTCSAQGVATLSCPNSSVQIPCIVPTDPPDDPPPPSPDKRVFISSATYSGNLGGLAGADAKCNTEAAQAGLSGSYMAWVSNNEGSPSTRFVQSNSAYVLVNGTVVANNWADLTDGVISAPINVTAIGQSLGSAQSWSNTTVVGGTKYANPSLSCQGFTQASASNFAYTGINVGTNSTWTDHSNVSCGSAARLMCFEQ